MNRYLIVMLSVVACSLAVVASHRADAQTPVTPLPQAHAHNDYEHARPLLDALDRGFCSVEADVWLINGELRVGHDLIDLRPERTLDKLYLAPLAERCRANNGWVHRPGQPVLLLVDFKSPGAATYAALRTAIEPYRALFAAKGPSQPAPLQLVISGDRPIDQMAADKARLGGVDGRLSDLGGERPAALMPLISDKWDSHFQWRGVGDMPLAERQRLREFAQKAHAEGRRLRFWATPESEVLWAELIDAEVDLIGTDDLARLQQFLTARGEH